MNNATIRTAVLAAALAFAGAACAGDPGQDGMSEREVRDTLTAAGYTDIDDVERDDGMWEADARRSDDGRRIDVRVDPRTGTIYPDDGQTLLTEEQVRARLAAAGYERIRDVRFDDGMWEADAHHDGVEYDLYMDPATAEVVSRKRD